MKKLIQKHFDRSILTYRDAAIMQKKVAAGCLANINGASFSRVLEIGAGGGLFTELFFNKPCSADLYVALDLSGPMLGLVQPDKACFVRGDGELPPFKNGSFDLLVSSSAMQWYSKGALSIRDNLEMLKPGGYFSLAVFIRGTLAQMQHVSTLTGFGSLYPLPSARNCLDTLEQSGVDYDFAVEEYTAYFPSVSAFLKSHKKTGAGYSRRKIIFGRKTYADFCRTYEKCYAGKKGIPVTYKVLYLWGTNKSLYTAREF